eukprot:4194439-Pleurochrysis_carterae.AAC.1
MPECSCVGITITGGVNSSTPKLEPTGVLSPLRQLDEEYQECHGEFHRGFFVDATGTVTLNVVNGRPLYKRIDPGKPDLYLYYFPPQRAWLIDIDPYIQQALYMCKSYDDRDAG